MNPITIHPIRRRRNDFTLVELLVVIAIISILAGLLTPALQQALTLSRQISCASKLRQTGLVMQQYVFDYRGWYPSGYDFNASGSPVNGTTWQIKLCPYLEVPVDPTQTIMVTTDFFECPDDDRAFFNDYSAHKAAPSSYGINGNFVLGVQDGLFIWDATRNSLTHSSPPRSGYAGPTHENWVKAPSQTMAIVDASQNNFNEKFSIAVTYAPAFTSGFFWNTTEPRCPQWHNDVNNYLFSDGHVEARTPEESVGGGSIGTPRGIWTKTPND